MEIFHLKYRLKMRVKTHYTKSVIRSEDDAAP